MARGDVLDSLRERWSGIDHNEIEQLAARLVQGRAIPDGPFGHLGHRVDLRGCPVTPAIARITGDPGRPVVGQDGCDLDGGDPPTSERPTWSALDLSGADLTGMSWMQLSVRDCVLDDADLSGLRCWGVTVTDSSLQRANLYRGQLGPGPDSYPRSSTWTGVDLRRADLRGAHAQARFERVDLRNARFGGTDWGWSDLDGVTFAGVVQGLTFGSLPVAERPAGWTLKGVDLTAARPRNLGLIGVDLGAPGVDVRLPVDDEHWHVPDWPAFLDRVAAAITGVPDDEHTAVARVWLEFAHRNTGPGQRAGFIAVRDVLELDGRSLLDTLRACSANG